MSNPFNPIDWIKNAQDWFSKSEKSSGFRPYLIFLILLFVFALLFLLLFPNDPFIKKTFVYLICFAIALFIILYCIKSFQEPDFCRSEIHIQRIMKLEMEALGTESHQISEESIQNAELMEDISIKKIKSRPIKNDKGAE